MSLLWVAAAEWNTTQEINWVGPSPAISAVAKSGSFAFSLTTGSQILRVMSPVKTEVYLKADISQTFLGGTSSTVLRLMKGVTEVISLNVDGATSKLFLKINGVSKPVGTININQGTYMSIELHAVIAVVGVAEFRIDGTDDTVGAFAGDTTGGAADLDEVRVGPSQANHPVLADNITLHDASGTLNNTWPGDVEWTLLRGNAIGNSSQFTPDPAADNYLNVNNNPIDPAKIVESTTDGFIDMYQLDNVPAEARGIVGVVVQTFATREAAGLQNLQLGIRPISTNFFSPNILLPTVSSIREHIFEDNPETSLPFTAAEVDAMELGMKSVT